jgi:hypothetical protein
MTMMRSFQDLELIYEASNTFCLAQKHGSASKSLPGVLNVAAETHHPVYSTERPTPECAAWLERKKFVLSKGLMSASLSVFEVNCLRKNNPLPFRNARRTFSLMVAGKDPILRGSQRSVMPSVIKRSSTSKCPMILEMIYNLGRAFHSEFAVVRRIDIW